MSVDHSKSKDKGLKTCILWELKPFKVIFTHSVLILWLTV